MVVSLILKIGSNSVDKLSHDKHPRILNEFSCWCIRRPYLVLFECNEWHNILSKRSYCGGLWIGEWFIRSTICGSDIFETLRFGEAAHIHKYSAYTCPLTSLIKTWWNANEEWMESSNWHVRPAWPYTRFGVSRLCGYEQSSDFLLAAFDDRLRCNWGAALFQSVSVSVLCSPDLTECIKEFCKNRFGGQQEANMKKGMEGDCTVRYNEWFCREKKKRISLRRRSATTEDRIVCYLYPECAKRLKLSMIFQQFVLVAQTNRAIDLNFLLHPILKLRFK